MSSYLNTDFGLKKYAEMADELPIWSAPFGLKLLDRIIYKKRIIALDIGCGTGFPLIELAMRLGKTSTVYGIDPWKEAIDRVSEKIRFYGVSNVHLFHAEAESIPLDNDSVDLIVSNNGLNNVSDLNRVLIECARIMKSGGQLVMTMNLDRTFQEFYEIFETVLVQMNLKQEIESMHRHIFEKRKPVDFFVSKLKDNGFEIKDINFDRFNFTFSDGTAFLNHFFIRMAFMPSWLKFLPANKSEQVFESIETRLNEVAEVNQGLQLGVPFVLINAAKE